MDDETKNTIQKLDEYLSRKGMDDDSKISFLDKLKNMYIQGSINDISLQEFIESLEDDDMELDDEDEIGEELDDDFDDDETEQPTPPPQPLPQKPNPLKVKRPVMKINQADIDKGNF